MAARNTQFPCTLCKFMSNACFECCMRGPLRHTHEKAISRYTTVNSTNVLSSHWFSFVWLAYSGNKFFSVDPNISEKCVLGGTNFRGVQIKRDSSWSSWRAWKRFFLVSKYRSEHQLSWDINVHVLLPQYVTALAAVRLNNSACTQFYFHLSMQTTRYFRPPLKKCCCTRSRSKVCVNLGTFNTICYSYCNWCNWRSWNGANREYQTDTHPSISKCLLKMQEILHSILIPQGYVIVNWVISYLYCKWCGRNKAYHEYHWRTAVGNFPCVHDQKFLVFQHGYSDEYH